MWRVRYWKDYIVSAGAYAISALSHTPAMSTLVPLESITELSPRVIRVLGQNPGAFTLQGTNTYLVGTGARRILIDTGEPNISKYIDVLREALNGSKISSIIITHWHHDHSGGLDDVLKHLCEADVPIYKVNSADAAKHRDIYSYVTDGHMLEVEGATLRFVTTPGHTADHASLWLEEEGALFSGDCILGQGTTVFEDLHQYMQSLERLKGMKPAKIYPGHGPVVEKTEEKIDEYIHHRVIREKQILEFFDQAKQASSMDVVAHIYKEAPLAVRIGALGNVRQHLRKLVKDALLVEEPTEYFSLLAPPNNSL